MNEVLAKIMNENKLNHFGIIPFENCKAANKRLYEECREFAKSVIIFVIPYNTGKTAKDKYSISKYARVYDYHKKFADIFSRIIPCLEKEFYGNKFRGYADHSPISEISAASGCKLGCIGKNNLLITEDYGSYVFIGSIITDKVFDYAEISNTKCIGCGKCIEACPTQALSTDGTDFSKCLSHISQKKTKTEYENEILQQNNCVWGCDICQDVCPMNRSKKITEDLFFAESFIAEFTPQLLQNMDDDEFCKYPFSWRKRNVISENINNCN